MARGFQMLESLLARTRPEAGAAHIDSHVKAGFVERHGPAWAHIPFLYDIADMRSVEEWDWFAKELQAFEQAARRAA